MSAKVLLFIVILLSAFVAGCRSETNTNEIKEIPKVDNDAADKEFEQLAVRFVDQSLELNPEEATRLGEHKFDGRLNDYSVNGIKRSLDFNKSFLAELENIPPAKLSRVNSIDYRILKHNLEYAVFQIETLKEHEWNPLTYNPGGAIYNLIARDFAPLNERLVNVKSRLEKIPDVLEAARANLNSPPKIHTETAISQNQGVIKLIKKDLQEFVEQAGLTKEFAPVQERAISALEEYGKWLENDLLPRSNGESRLGAERYSQKLRFSTDSDLTKEEILKRAEEDLVKTQDRMYKIALPLYNKFFPGESDVKILGEKSKICKAVLARLAEDRPDDETIVGQAKKDVEEATDFVRVKDLMTVPDEPLDVIEMPEFQRGVAIAYFDSAGPLEKKNETFYAIAPTPSDWDETRRESFFREYNDYMVKNLTVHEAMPGHYLQIMHSNQFKAPTMIRAIFRSGTFTEGWAVYSEQLMAENGYGGPEVEMQQLKMRLRVIINAIIDQKIHSAGMTEKQALDLMMNEGYQEEGEAAGKWRRANLTSAQLSTYFVGSSEMIDLVNAYRAKNGENTSSDRTMHDKLLSFGSPPPKYIKEMLELQ